MAKAKTRKVVTKVVKTVDEEVDDGLVLELSHDEVCALRGLLQLVEPNYTYGAEICAGIADTLRDNGYPYWNSGHFEDAYDIRIRFTDKFSSEGL